MFHPFHRDARVSQAILIGVSAGKAAAGDVQPATRIGYADGAGLPHRTISFRLRLHSFDRSAMPLRPLIRCASRARLAPPPVRADHRWRGFICRSRHNQPARRDAGVRKQNAVLSHHVCLEHRRGPRLRHAQTRLHIRLRALIRTARTKADCAHSSGGRRRIARRARITEGI